MLYDPESFQAPKCIVELSRKHIVSYMPFVLSCLSPNVKLRIDCPGKTTFCTSFTFLDKELQPFPMTTHVYHIIWTVPLN